MGWSDCSMYQVISSLLENNILKQWSREKLPLRSLPSDIDHAFAFSWLALTTKVTSLGWENKEYTYHSITFYIQSSYFPNKKLKTAPWEEQLVCFKCNFPTHILHCTLIHSNYYRVYWVITFGSEELKHQKVIHTIYTPTLRRGVIYMK